jgi:hypothetical protein
MKKFKFNLRRNIVKFFAFLLFSTLFFNSYAKNNDANDEKNAIKGTMDF